MERNALIKLALGLVMLGVAGSVLVRFWRSDRGASGKAFFYDVSLKKLFAAPIGSVPPIKGLDDDREDAVRAVVVSTNGNPADKSSWMIAYLETYSPELKKQIEAARATGAAPAMGRAGAQMHRFVRRLTDAEWTPLVAPEADQIVNGWLTAGPGGVPAVVCTP
jgi:hypothetical protein